MRILFFVIIGTLPALLYAQDEHPAFAAKGKSEIAIEYDAVNAEGIKKVEDRAVYILRNEYGLTLEEARAKVRIDGRTDVARCMEFIAIHQMQAITQAKVVGMSVASAHPEAVAP